MADFSVDYSNGVSIVYSGEASRYSIDEVHGVLTVYDGKGKRFRFSPSGWLSVQDTEPEPVVPMDEVLIG
jgi:hypothetical protein